jgi:hypothetical protein
MEMAREFLKEVQRRGRALRLMENRIGIMPLTIKDYENLKKKYENNDVVKTDVYGNIIRPYTLH